jgi:hypothetical protein
VCDGDSWFHDSRGVDSGNEDYVAEEMNCHECFSDMCEDCPIAKRGVHVVLPKKKKNRRVRLDSQTSRNRKGNVQLAPSLVRKAVKDTVLPD